MKAEFSEKQYEQLINSELINKWSAVLLGIPEYPTPQEEVRLGYDAKYTILENQYVKTFYFQYKISTYHDSPFGPATKYSSRVGSPFFLTKVRGPKLGNQHNVLRILSNNSDHVYYCAPKFYKFLDLNTNFSNKTIYDNSILISLKTLPDISDVKTHSIAYSEDGQQSAFFSEPVDVKSERFEAILERRERISFKSESLFKDLIGAIEKGMSMHIDKTDFDKFSIYGKINFLLNKYIGAKLVIIKA